MSICYIFQAVRQAPASVTEWHQQSVKTETSANVKNTRKPDWIHGFIVVSCTSSNPNGLSAHLPSKAKGNFCCRRAAMWKAPASSMQRHILFKGICGASRRLHMCNTFWFSSVIPPHAKILIGKDISLLLKQPTTKGEGLLDTFRQVLKYRLEPFVISCVQFPGQSWSSHVFQAQSKKEAETIRNPWPLGSELMVWLGPKQAKVSLRSQSKLQPCLRPAFVMKPPAAAKTNRLRWGPGAEVKGVRVRVGVGVALPPLDLPMLSMLSILLIFSLSFFWIFSKIKKEGGKPGKGGVGDGEEGNGAKSQKNNITTTNPNAKGPEMQTIQIAFLTFPGPPE